MGAWTLSPGLIGFRGVGMVMATCTDARPLPAPGRAIHCVSRAASIDLMPARRHRIACKRRSPATDTSVHPQEVRERRDSHVP